MVGGAILAHEGFGTCTTVDLEAHGFNFSHKGIVSTLINLRNDDIDEVESGVEK